MISCKFLWKYTENHFNSGVMSMNQPFARVCKNQEVHILNDTRA